MAANIWRVVVTYSDRLKRIDTIDYSFSSYALLKIWFWAPLLLSQVRVGVCGSTHSVFHLTALIDAIVRYLLQDK